MLITDKVTSSPPPPPPAPGPDSQAWIAGPVIGAAAGAAILVLLGFYVGKRRRARPAPNQDVESPSMNKTEALPRPPQELSTDRPAAELPLSHPPAELSGEAIGHGRVP